MSDTLSDKPENGNHNENLRECPPPRDQQKEARGGNSRSTDESSVDVPTSSQYEYYGDRNQQSLEHGYSKSLHAAASAVVVNNPTISSKLESDRSANLLGFQNPRVSLTPVSRGLYA
jgi:septum formation inhibitor-activating ATPase MinD